jgi:dUTP pyrophosphatase
MENSNQMGLDPNMYEQILKQFEKIKTEAGIEPDENYDHELEDLLGMGFDDLEEEIYKSAMMRTIEVETIHPDAVFPKYAYPSDSGFDLHSTQELTIGPFGRILVPTGLKVSFPKGYEIQVRPKSGLEIQVIVFNTNNYTVMIPKGMKVGQAVLCPVVCGDYVRFESVNSIEDKDRGDNGFGSTGI